MIDALKAALGDRAVLTGQQIPPRCGSDASLTGKGLPSAVVRPSSVEEVSLALRICNTHRQPVVPQGGMTGLAGGANPGDGDVVISMELYSGVEEIDPASATMTVRAGTPLAVAQEAAEAAGFLLPVDLGSRGSCQIGGNLATNAGGIRVIRHGATRDNVLGLEAVLADGTVISTLNRMTKNNTGYDLRQIFIGSEGTLGIITRAVLRLSPLPSSRATALLALESYDDVVRLLHRAKARLSGLSAFEAMWERYVRFNSEAEGVHFFDRPYPFLVIMEEDRFSGSVDGGSFEAFLGEALEEGLIADALIAQSEKESRRFWSVREGLSMDRLLPGLMNFDISLPIGKIGDFADRCTGALEAGFPGCHVSFFGHIGDSNLHIAVAVEEAGEETLHAVDTIVYGLVRDFEGSVSAEHGIGTLKRDYLAYSRSPEELEMMRRIKAALDPNGILNPGKVLPERG